jgi:spore coat protein U-like protein
MKKMQMQASAGRRLRARLLRSLSGLAVLAALPTATHTAPIPTTPAFNVNATVVTGCMVLGNAAQVTGVPFGSVNFGSHPAISTGTVTAMASNSLGTQARIVCTPGTTMQVSINGGQNLQGAAQRRMSNGSGHFIPYTLSLVQGVSTVMTPGLQVGITMAATAIALPIQGTAVLPGPGATAGTYADTVQVTVTW